jgi:hypothetical protein
MTLKYLPRLTTQFGHSTRAAHKGNILHQLFEIIRDAPPQDSVACLHTSIAASTSCNSNNSPSKNKKQAGKQSKKVSAPQPPANAIDDDNNNDDNHINNNDNIYNNENIVVHHNNYNFNKDDDNNTTKRTKKSNSVPQMLNIYFSNKFYHAFNNHAAKATKEQLDSKTAGKKSFWELVYVDFVSNVPNLEYDNNIFEFDEVPSGRFHTTLTSINPGEANCSVKDSKVLYKWWCNIRQRWSVARNNKNLLGCHSLFWQFCNGSADVYYLLRWRKEKNFDSVQLVARQNQDNNNDATTKQKVSKKQKLEAEKKEAIDKEQKRTSTIF